MELPAEVFADRLCEGECRLVAKIGFTWGVLSTLGVGGWTTGLMYQYQAESLSPGVGKALDLDSLDIELLMSATGGPVVFTLMLI